MGGEAESKGGMTRPVRGEEVGGEAELKEGMTRP